MEGYGDGQLAASIAQGDRSAEEELYRRYFPRLCLMLERRGLQKADAQDLAHDALITVLLKLRDGELDNPEQLGGYLHQTAKFLLVGRARKEARRKTDTTADLTFLPQGEIKDELAAVLESEANGFVRTLLSELREERDREILRQHYLLDCSKETVAQNLGLEPAHFDRVISRARGRFRKLYESHLLAQQGAADGE